MIKLLTIHELTTSLVLNNWTRLFFYCRKRCLIWSYVCAVFQYDNIDELQAQYGRDNTELQEAINHINRMMEELRWKEQSKQKERPKTSRSILKDFTGQKIPFEDIELRRKIGQGGFGDVYFAKWKDTAVAVKKLRVQRVSKRRLQEFTDEVLNFCKLDHPNIVQFIGACVVTPNLAIVMEYMQMSLFDALFMNESIEFSEEERLSILCQTIRGLQYLHDRKMAHCDLKSQNVLLDYGENCIAKITDFGLSIIKSDTETSTSTAEELVRNIGTPRYSAPEVLRGLLSSPRGMRRADIYSLSLIIYEVVFEEEPFYSFSYAQLRQQVGEKGRTPDIPDKIKVHKKFVKMIHWCWDFDPYQRPEIGEVYDFFADVSSLYKD